MQHFCDKFCSNPIWQQAQWIATTYRCHPTRQAPPVMGLVFVDWEAGLRLFASWTDDWGSHDEDDAIRIAFIEGGIEGQLPGYTIRISAEGSDDPGQVQRMHPSEETESLFGDFKAQYLKHGEFLLCPTVQKEDGQLWFDATKGIIKHKAVFRNAEDLTEGDVDAVVLEASPVEQALQSFFDGLGSDRQR
jgi:hypothetical protein